MYDIILTDPTTETSITLVGGLKNQDQALMRARLFADVHAIALGRTSAGVYWTSDGVYDVSVGPDVVATYAVRPK